ncbi:MAG: hypothetical protein MJZ17_00050 [Bacteroidales bacterium]|nr:hypothetical protein [Bacteroidales bacterium]
MIDNKEYRSKLIARYLEAETSVKEEIELAEYYSAVREGRLDADEAAVARLILADHPEVAVLSAEGGKESSHRNRRPARPFATVRAAAFAFAALALFFVIHLHRQKSTECIFSPMEIAQSINTMMNMDTDEIESIVAEPKGANVILIAKMKDGSSNTFIMSRNPEDGSTKILAQNNVKTKIR